MIKSRRRILYIQYTSPYAYPPLEHSSTLLAEAGWQVLLLGTSKHDDPNLGWPARAGVVVRELAPGNSGWRRKLHYAWFGGWVLTWALRWRPSWVYASDALACPVGLLLSYLPGVKVVYHEHDGPQLSRRGAVSRLVLWARRRLAARAKARVLPNQPRARQFVEGVANQQPAFTVWNCPARAEIGPPREAHNANGLRLLYSGSIVPFRLPMSLVDALTLLPEGVSVRVIGYTTPGGRGYIGELSERAAKLGVSTRLHFQPGMPHQDLLVTSRDADIGLVLMADASEDGDRQWMPGASNKPFDYLASGLALLVPDEPGWREMFVEPGYGLACQREDPHSIAEAVHWFLAHPRELRSMGERGRQRVAESRNYETQFEPIRALLDHHPPGSRSVHAR